MQPAANPEEIQAILGRFHTWAEKQPTNGNGQKNGAGTEELREIPYEEAIRRYRSRQAAQGQRRAAPLSAPKATASHKEATPEPQEKVEVAAELLPEPPPARAAEPLKERKAVPTPARVESAPEEPVQISAESEADRIVSQAMVKAVRARRVAPRKVTQDATAQLASSAAADAIHVEVPAPPAMIAAAAAGRRVGGVSATQASKPERKSAPKPEGTRMTAPPVPTVRAAKFAAKLPIPDRSEARTLKASPAPRTRPDMRMAAKLSGQSAASRKTVTRRPGKPHKAKHAPFRQMLAKSVQQPTPPVAREREVAPDRSRRITTRFTPAEQRRIEKRAAEIGLTVSTYLRQCALAAVPPAIGTQPQGTPTGKGRANTQSEPFYSQETRTAPAQSLLGSWLTLLRNRFVRVPATFTYEA